jgi:hypothetical protein
MPKAAIAAAAITATAAICVAVLGALLSYRYANRLQRRKAHLERLNAQLQEFYGPLYAIFAANSIAYLEFVKTLRKDATALFDEKVEPLNEDELRLWRLWVESAHEHRSSPAYEVIINKAHLLIGDEMPPCLLQFCAHKAGYDVVIERWKQGDYREHLSVVRHPGDPLLEYLRRSFVQLKRKQEYEFSKTLGRPGEATRGTPSRFPTDGPDSSSALVSPTPQ